MAHFQKELGDSGGDDFEVPLVIVNLVYAFAKGSKLPQLTASALCEKENENHSYTYLVLSSVFYAS